MYMQIYINSRFNRALQVGIFFHSMIELSLKRENFTDYELETLESRSSEKYVKISSISTLGGSAVSLATS